MRVDLAQGLYTQTAHMPTNTGLRKRLKLTPKAEISSNVAGSVEAKLLGTTCRETEP